MGVFLVRNEFPGKRLLVSMLTFPLAFPGVVVGFMVIIWAGRQGMLGQMTKAMTGDKVVLAYSLTGPVPGLSLLLHPAGVIVTVMGRGREDRHRA